LAETAIYAPITPHGLIGRSTDLPAANFFALWFATMIIICDN